MFECWLNDLIGYDTTKPLYPSKYTEDVFGDCKRASQRMHDAYFHNEDTDRGMHEPD